MWTQQEGDVWQILQHRHYEYHASCSSDCWVNVFISSLERTRMQSPVLSRSRAAYITRVIPNCILNESICKRILNVKLICTLLYGLEEFIRYSDRPDDRCSTPGKGKVFPSLKQRPYLLWGSPNENMGWNPAEISTGYPLIVSQMLHRCAILLKSMLLQQNTGPGVVSRTEITMTKRLERPIAHLKGVER
jgi:hypothetical protein